MPLHHPHLDIRTSPRELEKMDNNTFSTRDMEVMSKAWLCMEEQPKVNYEKLAAACGYTNVRSASNAWAAIKKKLIAAGNSITNPDATTAEDTPKSSKKRGKSSAADGETPTKKARGKTAGKTAKSKAEVKEEDLGDADDTFDADDEQAVLDDSGVKAEFED